MDKLKFERWIDAKLYELNNEVEAKGKTDQHEIARRIYLMISAQVAEGKFDK